DLRVPDVPDGLRPGREVPHGSLGPQADVGTLHLSGGQPAGARRRQVPALRPGGADREGAVLRLRVELEPQGRERVARHRLVNGLAAAVFACLVLTAAKPKEKVADL